MKKQKGVALIIALVMVAMAVTISTAIMFRLELDIKKTSNVLIADRAYSLALMGEHFAISILETDARKFGNIDARDANHPWLSQEVSFPVDEFSSVTGSMQDMNSKFNINNLVTDYGEVHEGYINALKHLFELAGVPPADTEVVDAIADWIDSDDVNRPNSTGSAEDYDYANEETPYKTADQPITSLSELKLIKGMTPEILEKVAPYLTVIPKPIKPVSQKPKDKNGKPLPPGPGTLINVNLADPIVLAAFYPKLQISAIESAVSNRDKKPFTGADGFTGQSSIKNEKPLVENAFDVKSSYFIVNIVGTFDTRAAKLNSMIHRDKNNKMKIIGRSRGEL